jgi:hypothetical protein
MNDRRAARRYSLVLPITILAPSLDTASQHAGKTLDISSRGMSFLLDYAPTPGVALDFTVMLPAKLTGMADVFVCGTSRVSRVLEGDGQRYRVATFIERYEISREKAAEKTDSSGALTLTEWILSGTYFESCNCETACPCVFFKPPTNGECTALIVWHIEKGFFGDTTLNGLNVAIAVHSPGAMMRMKWRAALYIDDRAAIAQKEALEKIFSGQAGGHPVNLAAQIGEILGVRSVPIKYWAEGKRRRLWIPKIAEAEIEGVAGQNGDPITIVNHPFCIAPGYPVEVATSTRFSYSDHGFDWDITEKNGFFSSFHYGN